MKSVIAALAATSAERKTSDFRRGDACHGHRGFLAGGGEG
jgi:hypothetical protein